MTDDLNMGRLVVTVLMITAIIGVILFFTFTGSATFTFHQVEPACPARPPEYVLPYAVWAWPWQSGEADPAAGAYPNGTSWVRGGAYAYAGTWLGGNLTREVACVWNGAALAGSGTFPNGTGWWRAGPA